MVPCLAYQIYFFIFGDILNPGNSKKKSIATLFYHKNNRMFNKLNSKINFSVTLENGNSLTH